MRAGTRLIAGSEWFNGLGQSAMVRIRDTELHHQTAWVYNSRFRGADSSNRRRAWALPILGCLEEFRDMVAAIDNTRHIFDYGVAGSEFVEAGSGITSTTSRGCARCDARRDCAVFHRRTAVDTSGPSLMELAASRQGVREKGARRIR